MVQFLLFMYKYLISSLILKLGILRCVYLWDGKVLGTFILAYVGISFLKALLIEIVIGVAFVWLSLYVFICVDGTSTGIYNFEVSHPRGVC